jgi:multidrug resistance efflux pump
MVEAAQAMVQQGVAGNLSVVIDYARRAVAHGKEAVEAVPRSGNQHARDTLEHLNAAIEQAEQVLADGEQGHQEAALTHARNALKQARRGLSHALAL